LVFLHHSPFSYRIRFRVHTHLLLLLHHQAIMTRAVWIIKGLTKGIPEKTSSRPLCELRSPPAMMRSMKNRLDSISRDPTALLLLISMQHEHVCVYIQHKSIHHDNFFFFFFWKIIYNNECPLVWILWRSNWYKAIRARRVTFILLLAWNTDRYFCLSF
jgi:hypothetical protein